MSKRTSRQWQYTGDVNALDYGGKWYREVSPGQWQFIELTNMFEACGRDAEGGPRYVVELSFVDLTAISPESIESALRSCG